MRPDPGRVDPAADEGFTLTELLVTITLMAVVSAALIASVVAANRGLGTANATLTDMAANRNGIERVGSLLRGAVGPQGVLRDEIAALSEATPSSVTFWTVTGRSGDQNPVQVRLAVVDGELVEEIRPPTPDLVADLAPGADPTYPASAPERVVVRDLLDDTVFTYWSHQQEGGDVTTRCGQPIPASPAMAAADLPRVDSVGFRLRLQAPTGYDSAPSDLQGWARFASSIDVGYSDTFDSAGCLDGDDSGFRYDDPYGAP